MIELNQQDRKYMERAMELAALGGGFTHPNPHVGAVIVKDGRIIGEGYHQQYGHPHAERNALASCTEDPQGATIYVTLEPCCHYGKTPPCTQALIERGIAHVVIGSGDPNPKVAGGGIKQLKEAGIRVTENFMKEECDALNPVFLHYINTGLPYVTMKYAMTMDGKIATATGASQWITGKEARSHVHNTRGESMGIMVGIGTVLSDDPELTCRDGKNLSPVRIICDTNLLTPLDSKVVQSASREDPRLRQPRTIIATCVEDPARTKQYRDKGVTILTIPKDKDSHVNLQSLMKELGSMKIDSILLEGGGMLNWSMLNAGLVQKVQTYIAPKIFGGAEAKSPVAGLGVPTPAEAFQLRPSSLRQIGEDYLIESEVIPCSQES